MRTDAVMMTFAVLALSAAVAPGARADFFDAKQGLNSMQFMGQYAVSTNIHYKRETNPSKKPEVAKPPRVFHEDFLEFGVNI